jgi:heat shock protein HslJ
MTGSEAVPRLAGRTFQVVEIAGAPVIDGTRPEVLFGFDGRVAGNATINRLMGPYDVQGDVLTCGMLASTMMAGPPEAMEQERLVLAALSAPLRVLAGDVAGEIVLEGRTSALRLREPVPPSSDASDEHI